MLQHEPQEQSAATPTAQIRVTAEELAQAINALEASKDEEAQHLAGTVAIGQVIDELKLDATPEELWAQVQKQRTRLAAEASAAQAAAEAEAAQKQAMRLGAIQTPAFRPRHRWRGRWWMFFGIGCAIYGITHGHFLPPHKRPALLPIIIVHGNNLHQTYDVEGKDVVISGNASTIHLRGKASSVTVYGDNDTVIGDSLSTSAGRQEIYGYGNTVTWGDAPAGKSRERGHHNPSTEKTQ